MKIEGIRVVSNIYTQAHTKIEIRGCSAFSIQNNGTVAATLFGSYRLEPGQVLPFNNIECFKYLSDSDIVWDTVTGDVLKTYKLVVLKAMLMEKDTCEDVG